MPIDPSIALGLKPFQVESPDEREQRILALENARQTNQLNQMKMGEYQRGIERTNKLRETLGGFNPGMSADDQVNALARAGFLDEAKSLAESAAKVGKEKRESEKALTDIKAANIKLHRDFLPAVRDQATYEQWGLNAIKDIPELAQILPAQYSPDVVSKLAMSADKFLESQKPHFISQENVMVNGVPTTRVLQVPTFGGSATTVAGSTGATYNKPAASTNVNVNAFMPASEEAQREFMRSTRVTYDALKQAPTVLDNIEKTKALIPSAKGFMGTGGEPLLATAKFLNNRLGMKIDTAGVKSVEELRSRLFMGIMDNLKKMDAQPSETQQQAMQQALGSVSTDPKALSNVLDVFGDIVKQKVDLHNTEVKSAEARGVKFPYDPTIKLPTKASNTNVNPHAKKTDAEIKKELGI